MSRAPNSTSTIFTAEFHQEFQAQTSTLLRRRFLWFCGIVGGLTLLSVLWGAYYLSTAGSESDRIALSAMSASTILAGVEVLLFAGAFIVARARRASDPTLLMLSYWLVLAFGVIQIAAAVLMTRVQDTQLALLVQVTFVHAIACLFIPWSWKQAIKPMAALCAVGVAVSLIWGDGSRRYATLAWLVWAPLVALPGVAVCWLRERNRRHSLKLHFVSRRYSQVRRELVDARRIHESLFPAPVKSGVVRMSYRYEPMHLLGGDFLHAHLSPTDDGETQALSVVIMDVTGHGIPAALTVNRLSGELHRLFAEDPSISPGDVLRLVNRYAHLTLASHSVYLTAICLRVDPYKGVLSYASGGHPPAFLRAVDGTVEELESTAMVLGACADCDFDAAPREIRFGPGDSLIAYTDGAIECRNQHGRMLGIHGLRRVMAAPYPPEEMGWPGRLVAAVDGHRHGAPADDTLVVEIFHSFTKVPRPDIPKSGEHFRQPSVSAGEGASDAVSP